MNPVTTQKTYKLYLYIRTMQACSTVIQWLEGKWVVTG